MKKTIEKEPIARYVYHFMPLGRKHQEEEDLKHVKEAVLERKYFFGNPLEFNDPFDCKPNFRSNHSADITNKLRAELEIMLSRAGIFCVAEELYRTLLWSHYANGHQGIVLQFDTRKIARAIDGLGFMEKVTYRKNLPIISFNGHNQFELTKKIIFTKSSRWAYEKEVRIVLPDVVHAEKPAMPVRNIYFGCKIDSMHSVELIKAFKHLPKSNGIFKLQMSSSWFRFYRQAVELQKS